MKFKVDAFPNGSVFSKGPIFIQDEEWFYSFYVDSENKLKLTRYPKSNESQIQILVGDNFVKL